MSDGVLTTYSELADLVERLPMLVRENRRRKGLSIRAAAAEIGCPFATLRRFELDLNEANGSRLLPHLLRWLDETKNVAAHPKVGGDAGDEDG